MNPDDAERFLAEEIGLSTETQTERLNAVAADIVAQLKNAGWDDIWVFVLAERMLLNLLLAMPADQRATYASDLFKAFADAGIAP